MSNDWQAMYVKEHKTVSRIWDALGIESYEDAQGKTIWELVEQQRADNARLRAELAAATEWRAIETAPKDTDILVLFMNNPRGGYPVYALGRFETLFNEWEIADIGCDTGATLANEMNCPPTHWMPLPLPPSSQGSSRLEAPTSPTDEQKE